MRLHIKILTILTALICTAAIANGVLATGHNHSSDKKVISHSGGLDSCGGHYNRKTGGYHYHRGPYC